MMLEKFKWHMIILQAVDWEKRVRLRCIKPPLYFDTKTPGFIVASVAPVSAEPDRIYYTKWRLCRVVGNKGYYEFNEVVQ